MADKGGEIYCKACYAKNFGPKGYGYGGGLKDTGLNKAVDASASDGKQHTLGSAGARFCGDCGAALGATLKFCPECGKPAPSVSASASDSEKISDASSSSSSSSPSSSSHTTDSTSTHSGSGSTSHESDSIRPSSATKSSPSLDRPSSAERPSSPKETTVGGNSAARKVVVGSDNPKCPLCGKSVYHAERIIGGGATWHQDCFKCSVCRNRFVNAGEANDKDGKLFCRACYAKNFGPKGYGYGGGSATTFAHTQ